jgi:hypothetical protein
MDESQVISAMHLIDTATLPDKSMTSHEKAYEFIIDMQQMEDGTWALPPMGKVNLIYIKIISIYVS